MRLPRKGILIRVVVYGGLLGFFGWRALKPHVTDPAEDPKDAKRLQELKQHSRTVTLPNGETQVIYEITPEQAERLFGIRPEPASHATKNEGTGETDAVSSESGDDTSSASH
jgi:hypothetical protein